MPIESTPKAERIYLIKTGEKFIAKWKYFGNPSTTLDPVTEIFRARRSFYEKLKKKEINEDGEEVETDEYEYDVHIVIEHRGKDTITPDGLIARQYGFSYCQYSDKEMSQKEIDENYKKLLNLIFTELVSIFEKWYCDGNGMSAFLKTKNKAILDEFLFKNKLKTPDKTKKKKDKPKKSKAEKRAERVAYAIAHPESTKKFKQNAAKNSTPD